MRTQWGIFGDHIKKRCIEVGKIMHDPNSEEAYLRKAESYAAFR